MKELLWMCSCPGERQLLYATATSGARRGEKGKKVADISPQGYLKETDARTALTGLLVCSEWIIYRHGRQS